MGNEGKDWGWPDQCAETAYRELGLIILLPLATLVLCALAALLLDLGWSGFILFALIDAIGFMTCMGVIQTAVRPFYRRQKRIGGYDLPP